MKSTNRLLPQVSAFVLRGLGILAASGYFAAPFAMAQLTESATQPEAIVHLKVSSPATPRIIPDTLFGGFLEPIGHSTYGGLWAQILENPSFEDGLWSANRVSELLETKPSLHRASDLGLPLPWEPLDGSQGSRYLLVRGDAANSDQSLLIMSLSGKEVGVLQEIYLPTRRELSYTGSLMAKEVRGAGPISVTLRRQGHPE